MHVMLLFQHSTSFRNYRISIAAVRMAVIIFIAHSATLPLTAQERESFHSQRIAGLFQSIVASADDRHRGELSDSLVVAAGEYLADSCRFESRLEGIRYFSQLFSPDSVVKLVTWNVAFSDGTNRYSCFVVRRGEEGNDTWLLDSRKGLPGAATDRAIGLSEWYGALYYDIRSFSSGGQTRYLLLGLDLNGIYTNSKVIDILGFDDQEAPVLGAPLIIEGNRPVHRMIFTYSPMVSMMLRYDSESSRVLFDHLSPSEPGFTGLFQYYGPDSSYDALMLRDGLWYLVEDIDLRNNN